MGAVSIQLAEVESYFDGPANAIYNRADGGKSASAARRSVCTPKMPKLQGRFAIGVPIVQARGPAYGVPETQVHKRRWPVYLPQMYKLQKPNGKSGAG